MRTLHTIVLYAMMPHVWLRLAWRARRHRMGEEGRGFVLSSRGARERTMAVNDRRLEA